MSFKILDPQFDSLPFFRKKKKEAEPISPAQHDLFKAVGIPIGIDLSNPAFKELTEFTERYSYQPQYVALSDSLPTETTNESDIESDTWITRKLNDDDTIRNQLTAITKKITNFKPSPATTKLTLTTNEAFLRSTHYSDVVEDSILTSGKRQPPYQVDLQAYGSWERNPNADAFVQEAVRMPIVHNQIRSVIQHLIQSKPVIHGGNARAAEIIKHWVEVEWELGSNGSKSLELLISDIATQLLHYGSCLIVKQRTKAGNKSYIDPIFKTTRNPVWSYLIADMATLEAFVDVNGNVLKWRQTESYGNKLPVTYDPRDCLLLKLPTQNTSLYFWPPSYVLPALYAITVQKNLHKLIDSHAQSIVDMPYYVSVGDSNVANSGSAAQIQKTKALLDSTPRGAVPIVNHLVKIVQLEQNEYTKELRELSDFWDREIRRGVGGSELQDGVGDSSTRNTSDNLTEREMLTAGSLVSELSRAFRWLCLDKLWQEGLTPDDFKDGNSLINLIFEDIDMAKQMRRETQATLIWQADGYTHDEYRQTLKRPVDPARKGKYFSDLIVKADDGVVNSVKSAARPTNQHKKTASVK